MDTPAKDGLHPVPRYPAGLVAPWLSVAVIGHRPDRLKKAGADIGWLHAQIKSVLSEIQQGLIAATERTDAKIRVLTSLAEGVDRLGAKAALEQGIELNALLPMPADAFEVDFQTPESRSEFRSLLACASKTLELPLIGTGDATKDRMYTLAAQYLLDQSDLLVAVWDGQSPAGRAGTTMTIDNACWLGMPVILIDASCSQPPHMIWNNLEMAPIRSDDASVYARRPLTDTLPEVIRRLTNLSEPAGLIEIDQFLSEIRKEKGLSSSTTAFSPQGPSDFVNVAYECADRFSVAARNAFRWAVNINFGFAGLATCLAALGVASLIPDARDFALFRLIYAHKMTIMALEVIFLSLILAVIYFERSLRVHRRWIIYRCLAEQARAASWMRTIGLRGTSPKGEETDWTTWLVRTLLRAEGMPAIPLDEAGRLKANIELIESAEEQKNYHLAASHEALIVEHWMEWIGIVAYGAAILFLITSMVFGHEFPLIRIPAGVLAVVLPIIGSALLGIRFVQDYSGVHTRSSSLARRFQRILEHHRKQNNDLRVLRARLQELSEILLSDVSRWRESTEGRKLDLPG